MPFIGLIINFFNNFDYFSQKTRKLPIRNGKDAPNIQIGITSFLYKISTQICVYSRVFGVGDFKHATKISREPRELPWQPNLGKNKPKMHKTSCLDCIVRRRNVVNGSEDVFQ